MQGGLHKITVQKPNRKRLFIAIPIEGSWQSALAALQTKAEESHATSAVPTHWTPPHHFHITVRFVGTVDKRYIPGIIAAIRVLTGRHRTFLLPFHGIEYATRNEPKMIWARFAKTAPFNGLVREMTRQISRFLQTRGDVRLLRSGHRVIPHVTLARAKGNLTATGMRSPDAVRHDLLLPVTSLVLYESVSEQGHTDYKTLATFQLPR